MMTPLEKDIRECLERDYVSFAELRRINGFTGDNCLYMNKIRNVVLWTEMSDEASECIVRLLEDGFCHLHPATPLVYLADGARLSMPTVKSLRHYQKPHWFPVTFKRGAIANCDSRDCPWRKGGRDGSQDHRQRPQPRPIFRENG
jgi:hypothetical protein